MRKEKLSVVASSAYRPADYQENLRDASEQKRDTAKNPYPLVALPGHSEHQLGMAADLVAGPKYTLDDFASTPEYAWLAEHAWEYGFVQSYPAGSEPVTGYSAESWHWRLGTCALLAIARKVSLEWVLSFGNGAQKDRGPLFPNTSFP